MDLQFQHVGTSTLREAVARSELSGALFSMLKRDSEQLGWGTKEKTILLDLATDTYLAATPSMSVEVIIRSLCHSRVVTADYVSRDERFNTKRSILIMGQLGEMVSAWTELVQPALYLFAKGYNIIWVEIPAFATNSSKWIRYGPTLLKTALHELQVETVKVLASGVGGSIFLETLRQFPKYFGKTHLIYNFDLPRNCKALPFPIQDIEELLRNSELQLWFAYNDEVDVFDRSTFGTAMQAFEAVLKLQARLEGERQRGQRQLDYDEVLVSEALNNRIAQNVQRVLVGLGEHLLAFSENLMKAMALFFELAPQTYQEDLEHGLPPQSTVKKKFRPPCSLPKGPNGDLPELPAIRRLRLGPLPKERPAIADSNRRRLDRLAQATLCLMPPETHPALAATPSESRMLTSRGSGTSATPALRNSGSSPVLRNSTGSRRDSGAPPGTMGSLALVMPEPLGQTSKRPSVDEEGGEESFFRQDSHRRSGDFTLTLARGASTNDKYRSMWESLRQS